MRSLFVIATCLTLMSCQQSNEKQNQIQIQRRADSLAFAAQQKQEAIDYKLLIPIVETQFWENIKKTDKKKGQNNLYQLSKLFKVNQLSPYNFYLECTELEKFTVDFAKERATIAGLQEKMSYMYEDDNRQRNIQDLLTKYNLSRQAYFAFIENYCSCRLDDGRSCIDGHCRLLNSEYWKHK